MENSGYWCYSRTRSIIPPLSMVDILYGTCVGEIVYRFSRNVASAMLQSFGGSWRGFGNMHYHLFGIENFMDFYSPTATKIHSRFQCALEHSSTLI
ncbi:hypothetical protein BH11PSE11_BH11PSE11_08700 [soil metagenome]